MSKWRKIVYSSILILAVLISASLVFFYYQFTPAKEFSWGISFSQAQARELGFNANEMYWDILNDLHPAKIRLAANWNEIEPEKDKYNFAELDGMVSQAKQFNVDIIMAVGIKLPHWPECHAPGWAKELSAADAQSAQLDMVKTAVEHFKTFPAIKVWQVENEPLFGFGENCTRIAKDFLSKEIALVKSLDSRPVLVTDSGEIGRWVPAASTGGDLFGATMYRVVQNRVTGYIKYPLPTAFFRIKAGIVNTFVHPAPKEILGIELQAEPWFEDGLAKTDLETQKALMNPKIFAENVTYAKKVGFAQNYLWGVEWWYWMARKNNDWGMWQAAKDLLKN